MQKNNLLYLWIVAIVAAASFTTYILFTTNPNFQANNSLTKNVDWSTAVKTENKIQHENSYDENRRNSLKGAFKIVGHPTFPESKFFESPQQCPQNIPDYEIITDLYTFPTIEAKVTNYVITKNYSSDFKSMFIPWNSKICVTQTQIVKTVIEVNGQQIDEMELEKTNIKNWPNAEYNPNISLETKILTAIKTKDGAALRYASSKVNIEKDQVISIAKSKASDTYFDTKANIKKPDQDILAVKNSKSLVKINLEDIRMQSLNKVKGKTDFVSETLSKPFDKIPAPNYTAASNYEDFIVQYLYKIEWDKDLWEHFNLYLADADLDLGETKLSLFFKDLSQCSASPTNIEKPAPILCEKKLIFNKQSNGAWLSTVKENLPILIVPISIEELKDVDKQSYPYKALSIISSEQFRIKGIKRFEYDKVKDLKTLSLNPGQTEYIGDITYAGGTNIGKNIRTIPDGLTVKGNLNLDQAGGFRIGKNSIIEGNVKIQSGTLTIEDGAVITGDVMINGGSLTIGNNVTIKGKTQVNSGGITINSRNVMNKVSVNSGYIKMDSYNKIESLSLNYPESLRQLGENTIQNIDYVNSR